MEWEHNEILPANEVASNKQINADVLTNLFIIETTLTTSSDVSSSCFGRGLWLVYILTFGKVLKIFENDAQIFVL